MQLIYINVLGPDYKNEKIYEFIFGDKIEDVSGEDWDLSPASGRPKPPDVRFIKVVGILADTDLTLELVQNSDHFSVLDAVDDVIALAWESYDDGTMDEGEEVKRLVFKFGETEESVTNKLKIRDLNFKVNKIR